MQDVHLNGQKISHFTSLNEPRVEKVEGLSWELLFAMLSAPRPSSIEKNDLPLWSPAVFDGSKFGYRNADNVLEVRALGFDIDEAPIPDEAQIREAFAGLETIVHSTSSATEKAPRWRGIVALSRPVTRAEYSQLHRALRSTFPFKVGSAAKDPSRAWYVPREGPDGFYRIFSTEGAPLDVEEWLTKEPAPEPKTSAPEPPSKENGSRLREAAAAMLGASWPGHGHRHLAQRALAGALYRDGWGPDDALEFLCAVCRHSGNEERSKRVTTIRNTWSKPANEVEGWPTLAGYVGGMAITDAARKMLRPDAEGEADFAAFVEGLGQVTDAGDGPIPFDDDEALPSFPPALPEVASEFAESVAEFRQTPIDMASVLTLACASGSIAGKAEIEVTPGYVEPLNLFAVVALPPGERKSSTFADVFRPLQDAERAQSEAAAGAIAQRQAERDLLENALKTKKKEYAKLVGDELHRSPEGARGVELSRDIQEDAAKLAKLTVPKDPQLIADDVTMERLAGLMAEQGGRMCVASAEGSIFSIASGRYSRNGQSSFEVLLKGHAGDMLKIDRQSVERPSVRIDKPCLTIASTVQPSVLQKMALDPDMRGQGLLARFMYSIPTSKVGSREIDAEPVPPQVRNAYHSAIRRLVDFTPPDDGPVTLTLSDEARALHQAFQKEVEPRLGPEGDLAEMADWGNKWPGLVARIAGVLHCVEFGPVGEVSGGTMRAAIRIGEYLLPHAARALGVTLLPQEQSDAKAAMVWLTKKNIRRFTERQLAQGMRPFEISRNKARRIGFLQELIERRWIKPDGDGGYEVLTLLTRCGKKTSTPETPKNTA